MTAQCARKLSQTVAVTSSSVTVARQAAAASDHNVYAAAVDIDDRLSAQLSARSAKSSYRAGSTSPGLRVRLDGVIVRRPSRSLISRKAALPGCSSSRLPIRTGGGARFDQTCASTLAAARANASAAHERALKSGRVVIALARFAFLHYLRLMRACDLAQRCTDDAWLRYPINASPSTGPRLDRCLRVAHEAVATVGKKVMDGHSIGLSEIDRAAIEAHESETTRSPYEPFACQVYEKPRKAAACAHARAELRPTLRSLLFSNCSIGHRSK